MNERLTVYLLRHGQTDMNADSNRYSGRTDAKLTELGGSQAIETGKLLESVPVAAIFASPLVRSRNTAELLGLPAKVYVDDRLTELDFGNWEGKTREEFIAEDPDSWKLWNENPLMHPAGRTGETAQSVIERAEQFFSEMIEKYSGREITVVGHNGFNRIYLAYKLGMPIQRYRSILQENSAVTKFVISQDQNFQLQKLNCK